MTVEIIDGAVKLGTQVITAVEVDHFDAKHFEFAVSVLRKILKSKLSPAWTFADKPNPAITFEGVRFDYTPAPKEVA